MAFIYELLCSIPVWVFLKAPDHIVVPSQPTALSDVDQSWYLNLDLEDTSPIYDLICRVAAVYMTSGDTLNYTGWQDLLNEARGFKKRIYGLANNITN